MSLSLFRPLEHQEPFFRNWARQHLLRGGNRSGKSTCAATMFASVALDIPVTLSDGSQLSMRKPWQKGKCLRMWVIGFDLRHIGETIHRLLFREGLFKIIKDKETGRYRAYRPWDPEDSSRESEVKDSAPLIPKRYIKPNSWDWENKKNREFKRVTISHPVTGEDLAEIYAYSSKSDPKAGDPVDFIWIDESIDNADHYKEWRARLFDLRGSLIWSSWPAVNNDALASLTEEALKQSVKPNPLVRETVITLSANKSLSEEVRSEALGMFTTDEEKRARDSGEYVTDMLRMYPLYDEFIHQAVIDGDPDEVSSILRGSNGTPPADWTIELALDPGTSHPGVLFGAIPPYHIGRGRANVVYDVLYPDRHDATQLAKLVAEKLGGRKINRAIIDWSAGRQTSMGHSVTNDENYRRAFAAAGVQLESGDFYFTRGSNNVGGRIGIVQEWMHMDPRGLPPLRIVRGNCAKLCDQLRKYKKSCVNNDVKDDRPAPGQQIDLAVALEYWAASNPQYVQPKYDTKQSGKASDWLWFLQNIRNRPKAKPESAQLGPAYT
jgi:hypothetical protein